MDRTTVYILAVFLGFVHVNARGDDSLHDRIDRLIAAKAAADGKQKFTASVCDDLGFLRRATLDLAGRIATADECRSFLSDKSSEKRVKLVDRLFSSDDYPQQMRNAFHIMLMERRGTDADWSRFLLKSFEQNKPWDQIVREIAHPNPENEETRGSAFFITKRLEKYGQNPTDYPGLATDLGRLFLGMNLACAQCHDHLFVDDYKQRDFQGMYAFISHTFIRRDTTFPAVGERPLKAKLKFQSVFVGEEKETGPRLPEMNEIEVLTFKKGEEFAVAPDRKTKHPGTPKFSPLTRLAEQLPKHDFQAFSRNIVNRMWFLMMGRGLVEPLDLHHSGNPPSHPKLLDLLGKEFVAHQFDIKWMLRELALTQTYQRSSLMPEGATSAPPEYFIVAIERPVSAEQLLTSTLSATGEYARLESVTKTAVKDSSDDEATTLTLDDYRTKFITIFGNGAREPEIQFNPSVKSALFVLNDSMLLDLLKTRPGNLVDRLSKLTESTAVAEELFLTVLNRQPDEDELLEIDNFLTKHTDDRTKAIGHLAWALIASTEFCVNH